MIRRKNKYGVPCVCGVYLIQNNINGKKYVGSSNNVAARVSQHFTSACLKNRNKNEFYSDIYCLGVEKFTCSLLEKCTPETKIEKEKHWYFELKPEYNLTVPTDNPFLDSRVKEVAAKSRRGEEYVRKQQDARVQKMRPCYGVSDHGKTPLFRGVREAARWVSEQRDGKKTPYQCILHVLNGERPTAYGYRWYEGGGSNE